LDEGVDGRGMNKNQTVEVDREGRRYVMGSETIQSVPDVIEVPCKMVVEYECGKCGFEWPDVLTPFEVKGLKAGTGCPECV